jgi:sulfur relay (sulfurtransferase) DsrC/TusE family protein
MRLSNSMNSHLGAMNRVQNLARTVHDCSSHTEERMKIKTAVKAGTYEMFPTGPAKGACKIAGLPKLTGCV